MGGPAGSAQARGWILRRPGGTTGQRRSARRGDGETAAAGDSGEGSGRQRRRGQRWRDGDEGSGAVTAVVSARQRQRRGERRDDVVNRSNARFRRNRDDAIEGLGSPVSGAKIETRVSAFLRPC
ncbi:hypothetical protein Syun_015073 [Stephania yunnanensis]|uniref:Uncharacterized protein n=1 Tax=Stephania yunnanensis TaxID=152371 RepID=A0AAP0P928_9MAGN